MKAAACATAAPRRRPVAARGRAQSMRLPRAAQGLPAIDRQEDGAGQGQRPRQARVLPQGLGHAQHAGGDQHGVGHRAEQHHAADVLAAQALAQHEGVLRADGHDQPEAQGQALDEDREGERSGCGQGHGAPSLPAADDEDKLIFLS